MDEACHRHSAYAKTICFQLICWSLVLGASIAQAALPRIATNTTVTCCTFNLALHNDGRIFAWGDNTYGQLGDGTIINRSTPGQVSSLSGMTAIAVGDAHSLALKSDGSVWTWGNGQLTPTQVVGVSSVVAIAAARDTDWALKSDGSVWAWGKNDAGQLGNGTTTDRATPGQVPGLNNVIAITANADYWASAYSTVAALRNDGTVWLWGYNRGQKGTTIIFPVPGYTPILTPTQVAGITGATAIAMGARHMVALKADSSVWAWGENGQGEVNGVWGALVFLAPMQVFSGAQAIAATAEYDTLLVGTDSSVWAWGYHYTYRYPPYPVGSRIQIKISGVKWISSVSGARMFFAIEDDGLVWQWQQNSNGQIGTPTRVSGIDGLSALYLITPPIPANNNFASRSTLTGSSGATNQNTERATKESGEPNHAGNPGGKSVWWTWTAPTAGQVILTLDNNFPTLLAAYTGTSVNALTGIGSSNNSGRVVFQAQAGVSYQMAVDGVNGASGKAILNWSLNPLANADLSINMGPDKTEPGQSFSYTVFVTNNGPQAASNVRVTIALPSGVSFVSASPGCTGTTTVVCNVGTIENGSGLAILITVNPTGSGNITATASLSTDTPDPAVSNNSVTVTTAFVSDGRNDNVPTLPEWGAIIMGILLLGTIYRLEKKKANI